MKVFVAALAHESNSFSPIPTSLRSFEEGGLYRPPRPGAPADRPEPESGVYADFLRLARERGHQAVPGLAASAGPSAPAARAAYETLRDEILGDLERALPVDMALLMLHGAQMADGYEDCEGDLLARMRRLVGPEVPIGVELDLHCNLTAAMIENATILMACKEYPHTDFSLRARELFGLIEAAALGRIRPVMHHVRVPMLGLFLTTRQPMRGLVDDVLALEGRDGVLSITLAHGFIRSDMPDAGASVVVVTDGDAAAGASLARALGQRFFALREASTSGLLSIDACLDAAAAAPPGPVVIADGSDNPGGGAAGDSTFVLRRMLERGIENAALAMLWDPIAVRVAQDAGVGAELDLRIGGKLGPASGDPLDVRARVTALAEEAAQPTWSDTQRRPFGPAAAIAVDGVEVVLCSRRVQTFAPECFTELAIDPRRKRVVVVKSNQHFHARFAPFASEVLYCDAPGSLQNDVRPVPYTRVRRPIWPLDG